MKLKIEKIVTYLLGGLLVLFGLNKGLNFVTLPAPPAEAINFLTGLVSSKYIFPTIMVLEILFGLSLIFDKFTRFTLIMLLPLFFNIIMYHLLLDPSGLVLPVVMFILIGYLIYMKRNYFLTLFD